MKYRLGYDYYWNCSKDFRYKGKLIAGASIDVLFSPIFEYTLQEYEQMGYHPDRKYKGYYLFQYFTPWLNKDKEIFEFRPTKKLSEIVADDRIDLEIKRYYLWEDRGILEPIEITKVVFYRIFQMYQFVDLQSTSYFSVSIQESLDND